MYMLWTELFMDKMTILTAGSPLATAMWSGVSLKFLERGTYITSITEPKKVLVLIFEESLS